MRRLTGGGRLVGILVDFPDRQANRLDRPSSFYDELLFSQNTVPTGSLRDFYLEQSYGAYDITGDVYGWFRTFEDYYSTFDDGNYGGSGGARGAGIAGILLADPTVDFGQYDSDGPDGIPNSGDDDGYVDALLIFFSQLSGVDTGDGSDFWPVIVSITPEYECDDPAAAGGYIRIDNFSIQPEVNLDFPFAEADTLETSLSVIAHEYGHLIGLPDLYDTSRTTWGIGYWGLMGYGSYGWQRTGPYQMSAWSKAQLGWLTPTVVTESMTDVLMPPVETDPVCYKVWRDGEPGDEYFLLENRQNLLHDLSLPGSGLMIWHVDESVFASVESDKRSDAHDYWLALEQADGLNDLNSYFERPERAEYYPEMGDGGDPYPGDSFNTVFDEFSNPSSLDRLGQPSGVKLENIALEGQQVRLDILIDKRVPVFFSGLRAEILESGVRLSWNASGADGILGFNVYRRTAASGSFTVLQEYGLIPPDQTSYLDSRALAGVSYAYLIGAVRSDGTETRTEPVVISLQQGVVVLHQNAPNPFGPGTSISFALPEPSRVELSIFSVDGSLVSTLASGTFDAGIRRFSWDGRDANGVRVGSGIYLYRLKSGNRTLTRKMMVLR